MEKNRKRNTEWSKGSMSRRRFLKVMGGAIATSTIGGHLNYSRARAAAIGERPIKVGYTLSLSGAYADVGSIQKKMLDLGVKQINNQGGILGRKLEVLVGDDKTSPAEGVKIANRLLDEGADFLIGGFSSGVSLAVSGVAKERKKIFMGFGGANELTGIHCNRYAFILCASIYMQGSSPGWLIKKEKIKSVYQISADYVTGRDAYETAKKLTDKAGVRELGKSFPALGTKDYSSIMTEVLRVKPELLILNVYGSDQILLIKEVNTFGLKNKMFVVTGAFSDLTAAELGQDMVEGVMGGMHWYHGLNTPASKQLWNEFKAEYPNTVAIPESGTLYVSLMTFFDAVKAVGSIEKTEDLINALEGRRIVPQLWNVGEYVRKCDHRGAVGLTLAIGKPKAKMTDKFDPYDVLTVMPPADTMQPCEETGCRM